MKKIVLMLAVILLSGCHPLDRLNQTDPLAADYKGMTYLGEIGSFVKLSDFIIYLNMADRTQDSILAVDETRQEVSKYLVDGTPNWTVSKAIFPGITLPTGICELNDYCYIIDKQDIDAFWITSGATMGWSDASVKGDKILAYNGVLYVATSDPPGLSTYNSDPSMSLYTSTATWAITKGDTTCANCMSYISDIAVHPSTGEILLVDSSLKRISIFSSAGMHTGNNIDIGADISSVALWGDTLYVPTTDGIRRYNYNTRALIDTIANYGEGNGRVMKPGQIELYPNPVDGKYYIYVGAGAFIKVFQISGF